MDDVSIKPPAAVADYKNILRRVLENRPSGTRQRLSAALGKNRSFISQITNPSYSVPIPAPHLSTIFEICHFSLEDRREFLEAYARAHPRRKEIRAVIPIACGPSLYRCPTSAMPRRTARLTRCWPILRVASRACRATTTDNGGGLA